MCQATAYVVENGEAQEIMRDVIRLVAVEGGIRLETFFEEPLMVRGRVERIDFLKHTVTLAVVGETIEEA